MTNFSEKANVFETAAVVCLTAHTLKVYLCVRQNLGSHSKYFWIGNLHRKPTNQRFAFANETRTGTLCAAAFLSLHWMALLLLLLLPPSLPSCAPLLSRPFPCVSSSRGGEGLKLPESTTRITRSIPQTICSSRLLLPGPSPPFPSAVRLRHSHAVCG